MVAVIDRREQNYAASPVAAGSWAQEMAIMLKLVAFKVFGSSAMTLFDYEVIPDVMSMALCKKLHHICIPN